MSESTCFQIDEEETNDPIPCFILAFSAPNEARDINLLTDGSLDNGKDTCMEIATATIIAIVMSNGKSYTYILLSDLLYKFMILNLNYNNIMCK